jgi:predicted Zn-dependent peptidase
MEYICTNFSGLGEKVFHGKLKNGLDCVFIPKPGFKRKFAVFATPYGAIHRKATVDGQEFSTPAGIAHFLEHKLFENPKASIENRFASLGASVNAYTTHTMTAYLFSTAENFYECLDLLLDFVQKPAFTPQGVVSERSIIAQEIKMYNDQPNWAVYLGAMRGMYQNHPVAEDIAGRVEDLEEIDYQLLKRCHELFYNPGRMVLVISGDLDAKELYHHVAKNQDQKKFPALPAIRYEIPRQDGDVESPARTADMEVARPMLCLGLKDKVARDWKESIHRETVASLLLEIFIGKNSSFYNRLYDDGIIDNTFGVEYTCTPWYSHFIFGGESDNPEHLANQLLTELSRLRDCGISQQLVDINLRKLMGLFIMDLNGLESTVMAYATDWLQQSEYLARFEDMRKLTKREVEEFLYSLDLKKTCLSVVKPLE